MTSIKQILTNSWLIALSYVFSVGIYRFYNPINNFNAENNYLLLPLLCAMYLQVITKKEVNFWVLGFIFGLSIFIGQGHPIALCLALLTQTIISFIFKENKQKEGLA